jgi:hypothetical protein
MENEVNREPKSNNAEKRKKVYPDSAEALNDDIVDPKKEVPTGDGMQVKSTDPDSEEWHVREDVNKGIEQ